jgi:hypothetical protein
MSILLTLVLTATLLPAGVFAAEPWAQDIVGHIHRGAIETLHTYGIVGGYGGFFRPDDDITRAEFAAMVSRAFVGRPFAAPDTKRFIDVQDNSWYAEYMKTVQALGFVEGYSNGRAGPDDRLTREQAALILYRILRLGSSPAGDAPSGYADIGEVSPWAVDSVLAVEKYGYFSDHDGRFAPQNGITRGEAARLLLDVVGVIIDSSFDAQGQTLGNVTIRKSGVRIKNADIAGELFISEGVGDGSVWLENINVAGRMLVTGGGGNSIYINGLAVGDHIVVDKPSAAGGQAVRFHISQMGETIILHAGTVKEIVLSEDIALVDSSGKAIFNILKPNDPDEKQKVIIEKDSRAEKITTFIPAFLDGNGSAGLAEIHTDGVVIGKDLNIDRIEAGEGITYTIGDETFTGEGITDPTPNPSGPPAPAPSPRPSRAPRPLRREAVEITIADPVQDGFIYGDDDIEFVFDSELPRDSFNVVYTDGDDVKWNTPFNAGTYNVTITRDEDDTHFEFRLEDAGTLVINKKELFLTGVTVEDKVYDGCYLVPHMFDTAAEDVNIHTDDIIDGEDVFLEGEITKIRFEDENAGQKKFIIFEGISLDGDDADNYVLVTVTADITPREISVAPNALSKTFGTDDPEFTFPPVAGGPPVPAEAVVRAAITREPGDDAGEYGYIVDPFGAGGNFILEKAGDAKFTIEKASVGAQTAARTIRYNISAEQTVNIASLINALALPGHKSGETLTYALGSYNFAERLAEDANVDESGRLAFRLDKGLADQPLSDIMYTIPVTVGGFLNYQDISVNVEVTVTAKYLANVTATAPATNLTYGDGVIGDPGASAVDANTGAGGIAGTFSFTYAGTLLNGTNYPADTTKPTQPGNYTVTATLVSDTHAGISAPVSFTIARKTLTWAASGTAEGKVYDGNTAAAQLGLPDLSARVGGDIVTVTAGTLTFASANAGNRAVTAAGYTIGGTDAWKYNEPITQPSFGTATITAKEVTITGFSITKPFDGNNTVIGGLGTLSFVGLVSGETANVNAAGVTAAYADLLPLAGPARNIDFTGSFTMTGGSAIPNNYSITQPAGVQGAITLASPGAPGAPTRASNTHNSVTLIAPAGANALFALEYARSTANAAPSDGWQDGLTFPGLTVSTNYFFFARYKADPERNNVSAASVSLQVTTDDEPDWRVSLSKTGTHDFGKVSSNYTPQDVLAVTVYNQGNQSTGDLMVTLSGANAAGFTLSKDSIDSIAVGGSDIFTVVPKDELAVGTYTATVTVSCGDTIINESFTVSFEVLSRIDIDQAWFDQASITWNLSAHYRLIENVTLSGTWTPIGTTTAAFVFDGNGHTISGLAGAQGLINTNGGTVKNLGLVDVNVSGTGNNVGGVAGTNDSLIQNCYVFGSVSGTGNSVGGIAGNNSTTGAVNNCYTMANVTGTTGVGGIVGQNRGEVANCYATGMISATANAGTSIAGGIVGVIVSGTDGTVKNSVALNKSVSSNSNTSGQAGRIAGRNANEVTHVNNFAWMDMAIINTTQPPDPQAFNGTDLGESNVVSVWETLKLIDPWWSDHDLTDMLPATNNNSASIFNLLNDIDDIKPDVDALPVDNEESNPYSPDEGPRCLDPDPHQLKKDDEESEEPEDDEADDDDDEPEAGGGTTPEDGIAALNDLLTLCNAAKYI